MNAPHESLIMVFRQKFIQPLPKIPVIKLLSFFLFQKNVQMLNVATRNGTNATKLIMDVVMLRREGALAGAAGGAGAGSVCETSGVGSVRTSSGLDSIVSVVDSGARSVRVCRLCVAHARKVCRGKDKQESRVFEMEGLMVHRSFTA